MRITLSVSAPDGVGYQYQFDKDEVLVGRDEAVDVRLPHPAVSLVHLRLRRERGRFLAEDVASTNGTRLDGQRLIAGEPRELRSGSRIRIAPFELTVDLGGAGVLTGPPDTASFARAMVLGLLGLGEEREPAALVLNGPQRGERRGLAPGAPLVVGRGEGCGLRLEDADASRQHLELRLEAGVVRARDLGSKNGVLLGGERIEGEVALRDGAELQIGQTRLRIEAPADRLLREVTGVEDQPLAEAEPLAPPRELSAASAAARSSPAPVGEPGSPAPVGEPPARKSGRGLLVLALLATLVLLAAIAALIVLVS
jgi:pSer/pThr/pTyr-binding forkhead associated (FHA) protein